MSDTLSEPIEELRIIDDPGFYRAIISAKGIFIRHRPELHFLIQRANVPFLFTLPVGDHHIPCLSYSERHYLQQNGIRDGDCLRPHLSEQLFTAKDWTTAIGNVILEQEKAGHAGNSMKPVLSPVPGKNRV